jgi:hypothetical protein
MDAMESSFDWPAPGWPPAAVYCGAYATLERVQAASPITMEGFLIIVF